MEEEFLKTRRLLAWQEVSILILQGFRVIYAFFVLDENWAIPEVVIGGLMGIFGICVTVFMEFLNPKALVAYYRVLRGILLLNCPYLIVCIVFLIISFDVDMLFLCVIVFGSTVFYFWSQNLIIKYIALMLKLIESMARELEAERRRHNVNQNQQVLVFLVQRRNYY